MLGRRRRVEASWPPHLIELRERIKLYWILLILSNVYHYMCLVCNIYPYLDANTYMRFQDLIDVALPGNFAARCVGHQQSDYYRTVRVRYCKVLYVRTVLASTMPTYSVFILSRTRYRTMGRTVLGFRVYTRTVPGLGSLVVQYEYGYSYLGGTNITLRSTHRRSHLLLVQYEYS